MTDKKPHRRGKKAPAREPLPKRVRIIILGAAGRDFHNFNVVYRDNPRYDVVGFTAAQIPNISNRQDLVMGVRFI